MNRLLEGDVGAGKTVVAALAMAFVAKTGYSAVLMAPTQILAEQHYRSIQALLATTNIPIHLITGNTNTKKDTQAQNGEGEIILGTHALLAESVTLNKIGLVVIDEQQRFGVKQRLILKQKGAEGYIPHLLTMTATPIPRTLALTLYGNLDLSVLSTLPTGRLPVKTWVVPEEKRISAYGWIEKQIRETKSQAFIICPLIEESEDTAETSKAAMSEYTRLAKDVFPNLSLGLLHGKLKPKEKTAILKQFSEGTIDILVATAVVEVGIDIPNATIILIESADRFGLSQMHQLRGRVGRGAKQSYCLLFTDDPSENTIIRLKAMETLSAGPELAEIDLQLRGPGAVLGTKQHGALGLKIARLSDLPTLTESHDDAKTLITEDPSLETVPLLRSIVENSTIQQVTND
jgi:ATP-dependent DNA helicase RecG